MALKFKTLYTPIVKGKENDFKAIGKMPRNLAAQTFPLAELLAPDEPSGFEAACLRFGSQLRKWCPNQRVSVDLHAIPPSQRLSDGLPVLEATFAYMKGVGVPFVPVFGFDHEPELWDRVAKVAKADGRGVTIRLTVEDLLMPDDTVEELLDRLKSVDISAEDTSLVIDLGSLAGMNTAALAAMRGRAQDFIDLAMTASDFGLVSIVGSSMPKDVSEVPREGHAAITRSELPLWLEVAASLPELNIAFGDFGIIHPNFSVKIKSSNSNAKIRYTSTREHHIFRGYNLRKGIGYEQYHDIARRVMAAPTYLGRDYSFGDDYVWRCGNLEANTGPGHLGTWVEADMNHHLVFAAAQLLRIESRVATGMLMSEIETIVQ